MSVGSDGCALVLELRLEEEVAVCFLEAAVGTTALKGAGGDGWSCLPRKLVGFWLAETQAAVARGSGKPQQSSRRDSCLRAGCRNSPIGFKFAFQALLQSGADREPGR